MLVKLSSHTRIKHKERELHALKQGAVDIKAGLCEALGEGIPHGHNLGVIPTTGTLSEALG